MDQISQNMNIQVVCEVCGLSVDRNKYERHKLYGHKQKQDHICNVCNKIFTSSYNLKYHMAHHINARSFKCNECSSAYNTASDLAQHQRTHDRGREFYCEECAMLFETRSKFNAHMKIHKTAVKKPYVPRKAAPKECPICQKTFMSISKHYLTVHEKQRNFNCFLCDKKFGKKSGLDRHIITVHKKEKNYKCEECGKAYGEKAQLQKHQQLHLSAFCSKCKFHFDDIKLHNKDKHSNFKHYCDICYEMFEILQDLESHFKTEHSTMRSYFCDYCGNGFPKKFQIELHILQACNYFAYTETC
ncbi:unnamed protein product [Chironomus riparius]|uniref:C2H2-type domain-containing protein n=1 Tax=Chironomus riparius TaxID=315576 RepID=A0A9N9RLC4_9DIPT|nr:unnamed protein product [Chironomus riparius]